MAILPVLFLAMLPDPEKVAFDERRLQATCGTCHPLDPVRAARLSRADWAREVEKMEAMGAKAPQRKLLLDYLAAHYGLRKKATPALRAR